MRYYLIDFENVGTKGFKGAEQLTDNDTVHLFSTKNAAKISTAELAKFGDHLPRFHEVPAKSQSLDMHLVSFLGYLMRDKGLDQEYIIISNDKDYDNIIKFWREEKGLKLSRQDSLITSDKKKTDVKEEKIDEKTALNAAVQKAVSKAGYGQKECSRVARIVARHYKDDDILTYIHNELRTEFGEEKYLEIYNVIKPLVAKKKKSAKTAEKQKNTANETSNINSTIQKVLSKAKYDNADISKVASLVSKNHKEGKQIIYRSIIKEYGAEKGLKIYNEIKALIK
ncbi:MAG: hypothetical protein K5686_07005 [Lachnospiraceae bacterium]|nr:hypothetical protein [Lachnospiraceae bacterium]